MSVTTQQSAADPKPTPKPSATRVADLTDEEIVSAAAAGRLHRTAEENTLARDAALERIAAQAEANAEADAKALEAARSKTPNIAPATPVKAEAKPADPPKS